MRREEKVARTQDDKTREREKNDLLNLSAVKIYVMPVCCCGQKKKFEQQFIPNWQNHSDFPILCPTFFLHPSARSLFLSLLALHGWIWKEQSNSYFREGLCGTSELITVLT